MPSQLSTWILDAIESHRPIWRSMRIPSDVIQDSYLDAYANRHQIREPGRWNAVCAYIGTIIRRKSNDWHLRESKRKTCQADIEAIAPASSPSSHLIARENASAVRGALSSLPSVTQEIVTSHLMDGETFREIADRLGWKLTRVTSRYRRAMERLSRFASS